VVKIDKITRVPTKLKAEYKSDFTSFTSSSVSLSPTVAKSHYYRPQQTCVFPQKLLQNSII